MVGNSPDNLPSAKKYAGRYFQVRQQPDCAVLLRPMTLIPSTRGLGA